VTDQLTATDRGVSPRTEALRPGGGRLRSELGARLTFYVLVFLLWIGLAALSDRVPGPITTAEALIGEFQDGNVFGNFWITLYRFAIGVAASVLLGLVIGVPMGLSSYARAFLESPVLVGLSMPAIIWAFLTVMWFGFGWQAPISTIVLTSVPFVAINIAKGAAGVSRDLRDMSQVYRVPLQRRIRHLVLPAVAGFIVAGVRFGIILGWQAVLLAEWFGSTTGVGFRARYWYDGNFFDGFTAWVILFLAFILILDRWVMEPAARRAFAWRDQ
jgi:ABC-type nitrate/sulfonate/bicarbonate transport system permease component